jgi:hypothetical protein
MPGRLRPFDRQQHRAAPFAPDADALNEAEQRQQDRAPDADALVGRDECDEKRRDAHQQQRRDECGLAAEAIAVVTEDGGADRTGHEADRIHAKGLKRADVWIGLGKEQTGKDEPRHRAVEEEVVPLDRRSDGGRDDGASKLAWVIVVAIGDGRRAGRHRKQFMRAGERRRGSACCCCGVSLRSCNRA